MQIISQWSGYKKWKIKNHVFGKENLYILLGVDGLSGFLLLRIPEINLTMIFTFLSYPFHYPQWLAVCLVQKKSSVNLCWINITPVEAFKISIYLNEFILMRY